MCSTYSRSARAGYHRRGEGEVGRGEWVGECGGGAVLRFLSFSREAPVGVRFGLGRIPVMVVNLL